jgi:ABC-type transport system involved in cytochrome c biogenesis ATPase subunit
VRKTKTWMLTLVLVIAAAGLQAQDAGKASGKTSNLETIQGCLRSSNGEYSLVDETDTIHHLTGAANKLTHYVGHQVEVAGKPGVRTYDTTNAGAGSSAVQQVVFEVKSVKEIAPACK